MGGTEILSKVLKIILVPELAGGSSTPHGTQSDVPLELAELADELVAEAAEATSGEAVAARYADVDNRRSLFDRALVGRLSSTTNLPVVDFLIGCFARSADMRSRKGSALTPELGEVFEYVSELCVSYSAIALQNPSMFPQPAEAEAEGALRLLRPLRDDTLPPTFLSRLVARLSVDGTLGEVFLPLFAKVAENCVSNPRHRPAACRPRLGQHRCAACLARKPKPNPSATLCQGFRGSLQGEHHLGRLRGVPRAARARSREGSRRPLRHRCLLSASALSQRRTSPGGRAVR